MLIAFPRRTRRCRVLFVLVRTPPPHRKSQNRLPPDLSIIPAGQGRFARWLRSLDSGWCVKSAGRRTSRNALKVERINSLNNLTSMSYITDFEAQLLAKLNGKEDEATVVRWISEKVLESYRNGITAGQKGAQVIRQGEIGRAS